MSAVVVLVTLITIINSNALGKSYPYIIQQPLKHSDAKRWTGKAFTKKISPVQKQVSLVEVSCLADDPKIPTVFWTDKHLYLQFPLFKSPLLEWFCLTLVMTAQLIFNEHRDIYLMTNLTVFSHGPFLDLNWSQQVSESRLKLSKYFLVFTNLYFKAC